MSLIRLEDPATEVARIAERDLRPVSVEQYGNETGIGGEVSKPSPLTESSSQAL